MGRDNGGYRGGNGGGQRRSNGNGNGGGRGNRQGGGGTPPSWKGKYGRIQMASWEQGGSNGVWYNLVMKRSYQDQNGQWQESRDFGENDIDDMIDGLKDFRDWIASLGDGGQKPQQTQGRRSQDTDSSGDSGG